MLDQFSRTELLLGTENIEKIKHAKIAIFGIGGVGSFVLEGLVRAGVENFILIDNDEVSITNINRQLIATHESIGKPKVEVARKRILQINPNANIKVYKEFFYANSEIDLSEVTYIVDAIDSIQSKIDLILLADKLNIPIISSMGAGNKLDPTKFEVSDIYKTSVCPLAKIIRKDLRKLVIKKLKVVYSKEEPIKPIFNEEIYKEEKKMVPGSVSFVPSVAGLIIAGEVIKDIINKENNSNEK